MERKKWPLAGDYLEAFGEMPSSSDKFNQARLEFSFPEAAKIIVGLEKAFPNAHYACVGRDVVLICDTLDVFYRAFTGESRVSIIGVSGVSFAPFKSNGIKPLMEITKKLLISNGFNPKSFVDNPVNAQPYVIIDSATWHTNSSYDTGMSQARLILQAAFQLVKEAGGNPASVVSKLGSVSTIEGKEIPGKNQEWLTPAFDEKKFLDRMKKELEEGSVCPSETMRLNLPESSYVELFWHEKYGPLVEHKSGKVEAEPGYEIPWAKKDLFNRMIFLNEYILSKEFQAELSKEALLWKVEKISQLAKQGAGKF